MIDPQGLPIVGAELPTIPMPAVRRRRWAVLAAYAAAALLAVAASVPAAIWLGMEVAAR